MMDKKTLNDNGNMDKVFNSWHSFIPITVTIITGLFAFYSGTTSGIYNLGYYNVFSISNSFVEPNTGFPNKSLLLQHIELLLFIIFAFWMSEKAYFTMRKLMKIKGMLNESISTVSKLLVFKEASGYAMHLFSEPFWKSFIVILMLHLFPFGNTFQVALFNTLFFEVSCILISFLFVYLLSNWRFQIQDLYLTNYKKYKSYQLNKLKIRKRKEKKSSSPNGKRVIKVDADIEKIIDEFHYPDETRNQVKWIEKIQTPIGIMFITAILTIFIVGLLLFCSYYVGKADALYQHNYYLTSDNNHVALPVSSFLYAIIEIDYIERKDDTLVAIRTDKPIEFRKNSIPVQSAYFENVCVVNQNGDVITDPLCALIYFE